jgi:hypothetical protein
MKEELANLAAVSGEAEEAEEEDGRFERRREAVWERDDDWRSSRGFSGCCCCGWAEAVEG